MIKQMNLPIERADKLSAMIGRPADGRQSRIDLTSNSEGNPESD